MVSLVIVESPGKIKTIGDILTRLFGKGRYRVLASYGHIRDLPDETLGIDIAAGFRPQYVISDAKKAVVKRLRAAVKEADMLYLASDPDREGESIAWHLVQTLKPTCPVKRVAFNAITESAIQAGFAAARPIDRALVAAQESRRILDRLVGYKISPLLWDRLPQSQGLSAGRVQSVALRLVVEREHQINGFQPRAYWSIRGRFAAAYGSFEAKLSTWRGQPWNADLLPTQASAEAVRRALTGAAFTIAKLEQCPTPKRPAAPFTTSTLQQAAWSHLSLSPEQTMEAAQKLYEAGSISYMRTDSVAISPEALNAVATEIATRFGDRYLADPARIFKAKDGAQEAHECIRPNHVEQDRLVLSDGLNESAVALYTLIWQRFVACQMAEALYSQTVVYIAGGDALFRVSGRGLTFDGFLRVYGYGDDVAPVVNGSDEPPLEASRLPLLMEGESVQAVEISTHQQSTQAPLRFSEAGLVKELEGRGIGRPSTFANTVAVLKTRGTATIVKKTLVPTETGMRLLDVLVKHFSTVFDVDFTARMEASLDEIAAGSQTAPVFLSVFWRELKPLLEALGTPAIKPPTPQSNPACPRCHGSLMIRTKKDGSQFLGCTAFPQCRYSRGVDEVTTQDAHEICPQCGKRLVTRNGRKGTFVGCSGFPSCKFTRSCDDLNPKPL